MAEGRTLKQIRAKQTKRQRAIISEIAQRQEVEKMVQVICKVTNTLLQDLAQVVYVALLEYDGKRIEELHDNGQLSYFVVRIIQNQWFSNTSPFYHSHRKFSRRSNMLTETSATTL